MKKTVIILALIAALLIPRVALAAETATATMQKHGEFVVVIIDWESHTDGTCTYAFESAVKKAIQGKSIYMAITDPDAATDNPTADYDITLDDSYGADAMGGALANRHTSTSEQAVPAVGSGIGDRPYIGGSLTMEITNAGSLNKGILTILFH